MNHMRIPANVKSSTSSQGISSDFKPCGTGFQSCPHAGGQDWNPVPQGLKRLPSSIAILIIEEHREGRSTRHVFTISTRC